MYKAPRILQIAMDEIINERIKRGKNKASDIKNKTLSYKRIGLAIARDNVTKERLINADFLDEKRGAF